MSKRYYCKMSDGGVVNFEAPSAAQAQCSALEACIGRSIIECWTGDSARRPEFGFTEFEVPVHVALEAPPIKRKRDLPDNTIDMFPEIKSGKKTGAFKDA